MFWQTNHLIQLLKPQQIGHLKRKQARVLPKPCNNQPLFSADYNSQLMFNFFSNSKSFTHQQQRKLLDAFEVRDYQKPSTIQQSALPNLDYGTLNPFKLDDLVNIQSDGFNEHKVIRLASVEGNVIHLDEEGVEVFERYCKSQVGFVGVYGKRNSGKSLLLDKIVNLCEIEGSYVCKLAITQFSNNTRKQKGLYIWGVPFEKGNLKLFLMDIDGYDSKEDEEYFLLLDLMMLLCSGVFLLSNPFDCRFDELDLICEHLKRSRSRFQNITEQATCWPQSMYCLFRDEVYESQGLSFLRTLFSKFNFSIIPNAMEENCIPTNIDSDLRTVQMKKYGLNKKILSSLYILKISSLIRDIYYKIQVKTYMNMRLTGANTAKLIVNAVQSLNIKGRLNIQKLYLKTMKQLYAEAYNFHSQMYNSTLIEYLQGEEALPADQLLKVFNNSSEQIMQSFNSLLVNEELRDLYGQKLQRYISEKEKIVLEINKKKSLKKVKVTVPELKPAPEVKQLTQFIEKARKVTRTHEQTYSEQLARQMVSGLKKVDKQTPEEKQLLKKSNMYSQRVQVKRNQLEEIRRINQQKFSGVKQTLAEKVSLQKKNRQLEKTLGVLKSQIPTLNEMKSLKKTKSVQGLKMEEMRLRREKEKRDRMIEEMRLKGGDSSQDQLVIEKMERQIALKVSQQRQITNTLSSRNKVTSIQIIKSTTSLNTVGSPRKVQSRAFNKDSNIRVIHSPKA